MGLEAAGELRIGSDHAHVKALLESRDLIFRGALRKTLPIADLKDPRVVNDELLFEHEGQPYALSLPAGQAAKWLKKLTTAPPTLAAKLGIDSDHRAFVTGHVDDAALKEALLDAVTTDPLQAAVSVIIAHAPEELSAGLSEVIQRQPHAPIWVVYPKGPKSPLPDSAVRTHMHALNLIDTKSSAVSDSLTATRFSQRKAP